jgi:hypothetical protein
MARLTLIRALLLGVLWLTMHHLLAQRFSGTRVVQPTSAAPKWRSRRTPEELDQFVQPTSAAPKRRSRRTPEEIEAYVQVFRKEEAERRAAAQAEREATMAAAKAKEDRRNAALAATFQGSKPASWPVGGQADPRVLLYVTTHASEQHLRCFQRWPAMLAQPGLRNAEVFMYTSTNDGHDLDSRWRDAIAKVPRVVGQITVTNPGYQEGAIKAVHDERVVPLVKWDSYDWIVRLNPDVRVLNGTWLQGLMMPPQLRAILFTCEPSPGYCWRGEKNAGWVQGRGALNRCRQVMTDFTVLRPALFVEMLKGAPRPDGKTSLNAEQDMHLWTQHLRLDEAHWIYGNHYDECRTQVAGLVWHAGNFGSQGVGSDGSLDTCGDSSQKAPELQNIAACACGDISQKASELQHIANDQARHDFWRQQPENFGLGAPR